MYLKLKKIIWFNYFCFFPTEILKHLFFFAKLQKRKKLYFLSIVHLFITFAAKVPSNKLLHLAKTSGKLESKWLKNGWSLMEGLYVKNVRLGLHYYITIIEKLECKIKRALLISKENVGTQLNLQVRLSKVIL